MEAVYRGLGARSAQTQEVARQFQAGMGDSRMKFEEDFIADFTAGMLTSLRVLLVILFFLLIALWAWT